MNAALSVFVHSMRVIFHPLDTDNLTIVEKIGSTGASLQLYTFCPDYVQY